MAFKEKDFIEIEFTGKVKDGEIFDSNIAEDLAKIKSEAAPKPFAFCLGQGMFLKGMENFLIGKELGEYEVELKPDQAFGPRDSKLIQMIPMKVFREQKINPVAGIMFNFDNRLAKILTVSGGRVMVDFNNPVAGKDVVYKIKVLRKIEKQDEKIKALNEFLFRKEFKFEIKEKKVILEVEKQMLQFVEMFKDKFKEILGLDLEVKEKPEKKEIKKAIEKVKKQVKEKVSEEVGKVVEEVKK
jgi:FKBP-type peptidyl-prolyl cis-trans isomerase 2